ncbi:phytanoyl-CoA dioxygenase family protein [Paenibacillus antri]|nr:phytanoyl-CoA dioxygenase family protein [Paenibacillus antri]
MVRNLTYEQLQSYNDTGYLVLRNVFTEEEVRLWRAECDRLLSLKEYVDPLNLRVAYRKAQNGERMIEKFDPLLDVSPVFGHLFQDERILTPLRDIYLDEPLLFKDKLIFKLPGNTGYTMHQDAAFWHGFPYEGLISVMVAIDGATKENGALELFPGYHDKFRQKETLRNFDEEEIAQIDASKGVIYDTNPGDMILFSSLTPHQSGTNTTQSSRRQLFLTYSPSKNGRLYKAHYQHYVRYVTRGRIRRSRTRDISNKNSWSRGRRAALASFSLPRCFASSLL